MYITRVSAYIPEKIIDNAHFEKLMDVSEEWLLSRTGIRERRKAASHENTNTMGIRAVAAGLDQLPFDVSEVDLIIGGTYTPYDTIHTLGHAVQNFLNISDIPVLSLSSACSSFANALEVAEGYFASGKARRALVVLADHNTAYSDETDKQGGHLWGDGASALWISQEAHTDQDWKVLDILTGGAGNIGKASESVFLRPAHEGFQMAQGRDVFQNACLYMAQVTQKILAKNGFQVQDLDYFVPHQANLRITRHVAQSLGLEENQALSNIQYLGNTGCAGCSIALWENQSRFQAQDLIAVTVFGGGYSYGSVLIQV
ncbi:MAG: ketoacyl-ACP synthase III [Microscillaceae bacterium]|nr:ketoacyl-ACP synthase III [Microscillaceae bacterium]